MDPKGQHSAKTEPETKVSQLVRDVSKSDSPPSVVDRMSFPTRPSSYSLFVFVLQHLFGPVACFIASDEPRKHTLDDTSVLLSFGGFGSEADR